jgi:hypothetical protein
MGARSKMHQLERAEEMERMEAGKRKGTKGEA